MRRFPLHRGTPLMLALAAGAGAFAQVPALGPLNEDEAAITQVYLRATPLGDGLNVFSWKRTGLVPLGEICRLIQFPIEVDAHAGRATGFFIQPDRPFRLDLATRTVVTGGRTLTFAPEQVRSHAGDLYVEAALLEAWFPLVVKLEFRDSSLYLSSREPLPIEQAWDRARANARLLSGGGGPPDAAGPLMAHPYRALSLPVVDLSATFRHTSKGPSTDPQASLGLGGDLLWMSASAYVTRDASGSFRSSRATLYRDDPDGRLLGPLRARHISLGDLRHGASLDLAGGLPTGRGLGIDNLPLDFRTRFATRVFRGTLPPGWSVELFRNNGLVGFQQARPDATYEFPPVDLTFGINTFRLVFHGPHGERREEQIRLDIGQDQPEPGAFYYRMAAIKPQELVDPAPDTIHVTDEPAYLAEVEAGLSARLSAHAGFLRMTFSNGLRSYGVAGLRTVLPWVSVDVTGAASAFTPLDGADTPKGKAGQVTLRTGLGYSSLMARHAEYRGGYLPVQDVTTGAQGTLLRDDALTLSGSTYLGGRAYNAAYTFLRQGYDTGRRESQRISLGTTLGRVSLSQAVGTTVDSTGARTARSLEALLLASSFFRTYGIQAEIQGRKQQQASFRLENYAVNLTRAFDSGVALQAVLRGSFRGGSGGPSLTASLLQQKGRWGWGIDGAYSKSGGLGVGVRLQVSLGRDPRSRRWFMDAQPLSGMGAVSARAFLDDNGNGKRDPGEKSLNEPRFRVGDATRTEIRADAETALYTGIGTGRDVPISLDVSSLEDMTHQPRHPRYTIRPRAGVVTPVDYPVVVLGEVMGTCRLRRGGRVEELAGLQVELTDDAGRVLQSQRSAFDGFFEFRNLPLGSYRLRVAPSEVQRLQLREPGPRVLDLNLQRPFAEGQDLVVEPLEPAVEPERPREAPKPTGKDPEIRVVPGKGSGTGTFLRSIADPDPPAPRRGPAQVVSGAPAESSSRSGQAAGLLAHGRIRLASARRPHPTPSQIAAARLIARALAVLVPERRMSWFPNPFAHRSAARRPHPAAPTRQSAVPAGWTILLLPARSWSTVEVLRRNLDFLAGDLIVHQPGGGAPMQVLLGRFDTPAAAQDRLRRLPAGVSHLGLAPTVVPFPDQGANT